MLWTFCYAVGSLLQIWDFAGPWWCQQLFLSREKKHKWVPLLWCSDKEDQISGVSGPRIARLIFIISFPNHSVMCLDVYFILYEGSMLKMEWLLDTKAYRTPRSLDHLLSNHSIFWEGFLLDFSEIRLWYWLRRSGVESSSSRRRSVGLSQNRGSVQNTQFLPLQP